MQEVINSLMDIFIDYVPLDEVPDRYAEVCDVVSGFFDEEIDEDTRPNPF